MGTGKKKIDIEKITKKSAKIVAFLKRRKGLFRKAEELESLTSYHVTSIIFSPFDKLKLSPASKGNGLRGWVEDIDVEGCQNLN
ncbi:hypothetical protein RDI58_024039 [Solanum bulbocastanum]|uniref:MADS-box domain-containing protein n=1 Tax=Solanum bulbocastanum TaxID=147425 RepID=A0AAN8T0J4_SOLBU